MSPNLRVDFVPAFGVHPLGRLPPVEGGTPLGYCLDLTSMLAEFLEKLTILSCQNLFFLLPKFLKSSVILFAFH